MLLLVVLFSYIDKNNGRKIESMGTRREHTQGMKRKRERKELVRTENPRNLQKGGETQRWKTGREKHRREGGKGNGWKEKRRRVRKSGCLTECASALYCHQHLFYLGHKDACKAASSLAQTFAKLSDRGTCRGWEECVWRGGGSLACVSYTPLPRREQTHTMLSTAVPHA